MGKAKLTGLIAATPTPMRADFSLNLKPVEVLADHLVRDDISAVYVGATAGEFPSLTLEERQRLARELHDSVAQSLYSLTLLAEASRRTARSGEVEKVEGQITRLGEMAQQTLKEMRLLVYQLRPRELESDSLAEAIQHRLDAVEKRSGVNAQFGKWK